PPELARELPGPQASTSVTRAPRRRSISAVQPPNAPAPTTVTDGGVDGDGDPAGPDRAKTRAAEAAGSIARKPRRESTWNLASEIEPGGDAERARLVRQEPLAGEEPALAVQRKQRLLVGDVVDVERNVPDSVADAHAEVEEVVGRQQGIEGEGVLCQRTGDREAQRARHVLQRDDAGAGLLVHELRVAVPDVRVVAGHVAPVGRRDRMLIGRGERHLELGHAGQAVALPDTGRVNRGLGAVQR